MSDKDLYRPEGIDDAFSHPEPEARTDQGEAAPGTDETSSGTKGRPKRASTGGSDAPPQLPALGLKGTLRWTWRQLTSMRVALMLLMLLAVAAVPGSVLPDRKSTRLNSSHWE